MKRNRGRNPWALVLAFLLSFSHAGQAGGKETLPLFGPIQDYSPPPPSAGFYLEGYTAGLFPTDDNRPEPLATDANFSSGGGAGFGYQFNEVVSVGVSGQAIRVGSGWIQDITLDVKAYLPQGDALEGLFPDLISFPDIRGARLYLLLGAGAQYRETWDSLLRAGGGVEFPLSETLGPIRFYLEATYNVVGIGRGSELDPYPSARSGIRFSF